MTVRLYSVDLPWANFGIHVDERNVCTTTAPIGRWMIGKSLDTITRWVLSHNGSVTLVSHAQGEATPTRLTQIGFTGTRWMPTIRQHKSLIAILRALKTAEKQTLHHGDCHGADSLADVIARDERYSIAIHPPSNDRLRAFLARGDDTLYPEKPYLARDRDIVSVSDILIACPRTHAEELRSGTWATIREARRQKKPVTILWP